MPTASSPTTCAFVTCLPGSSAGSTVTTPFTCVFSLYRTGDWDCSCGFAWRNIRSTFVPFLPSIIYLVRSYSSLRYATGKYFTYHSPSRVPKKKENSGYAAGCRLPPTACYWDRFYLPPPTFPPGSYPTYLPQTCQHAPGTLFFMPATTACSDAYLPTCLTPVPSLPACHSSPTALIPHSPTQF